ncbi:MAG: M16 family metallopeptidase [Mangrovibacterium sp.]
MKIDRQLAPELHPINEPELLKAQCHRLDNGIPVYFIKAGKQDVCKIDFVFDAGVVYQDKPLLSSLSNAMLQEGTSRRDAAEIAEIFDFHGAYLQLAADYHNGTASLVCLDKHLGTLLPVMEDLIKNSAFPETEFNTLVQRRKQRFILENEKAKILCQKKFSEVLFGIGHPYTLRLKTEDFDEVELTNFRDFYKKHYHSSACEVFISGQFQDDVFELLNHYFGAPDWTGEKLSANIKPPISSGQKFTQVLKADSIQSAIRMGKLLVQKNHPDYYGLQVLTTILGGYFSSRLMTNIREEKGYTYGIGANFVSLNEAGYLLIATEVDKTYEADTLHEINKELELLTTEPVSDDELERVKQYLTGEFLREFDGPFALSQAFRNIHDFHLDYSFYDKFFNAIQPISADDLMQLAKKYFMTESFYTVVAGKA